MEPSFRVEAGLDIIGFVLILSFSRWRASPVILYSGDEDFSFIMFVLFLREDGPDMNWELLLMLPKVLVLTTGLTLKLYYGIFYIESKMFVWEEFVL